MLSQRYRKWKLSDNDDMDIIVRCEVDAVSEGKEKPYLVSVKALNEFCGAKPVGKNGNMLQVNVLFVFLLFCMNCWEAQFSCPNDEHSCTLHLALCFEDDLQLRGLQHSMPKDV